MEFIRKSFPEILPDNEELYFKHFIGVLESVDELASVQVTKTNDSYKFRIAPSAPRYNNIILEQLLSFHNMFGLKLDLSKSIKTSGTLAFQIKI